jgi:hypothetical protein
MMGVFRIWLSQVIEVLDVLCKHIDFHTETGCLNFNGKVGINFLFEMKPDYIFVKIRTTFPASDIAMSDFIVSSANV